MELEFFAMSKITYPTTETYVPQKLKVQDLSDNLKSRNNIHFLSMHEYTVLVLPKTLEWLIAIFWNVTTRNLVKFVTFYIIILPLILGTALYVKINSVHSYEMSSNAQQSI
jgi:hypothetical protein